MVYHLARWIFEGLRLISMTHSHHLRAPHHSRRRHLRHTSQGTTTKYPSCILDRNCSTYNDIELIFEIVYIFIDWYWFTKFWENRIFRLKVILEKTCNLNEVLIFNTLRLVIFTLFKNRKQRSFYVLTVPDFRLFLENIYSYLK
jgi:hypothetical protein